MISSPSLFISHAGADANAVLSISAALSKAGVSVILDQHNVLVGDDLINFMETGLQSADYCLLLWSQHAECRYYVSLEWHAALAKEASQKRIFLLVGRLDSHPLPALLQCRRYIDFFPTITAGIAEISALWQRDQACKSSVGKPVLPPLTPPPGASSGGVEVYISSELFDCTIPVVTPMEAPIGCLLNTVLTTLNLPGRLSLRDRIGFDLTYRLAYQNHTLERNSTLRDHGINAGDVLLLEVEAQDFAGVAPIRATDGRSRVFRSGSETASALSTYLAQVGLRNSLHVVRSQREPPI
jgi:TIR domain